MQRLWSRKAQLSKQQLLAWDEAGFLILPSFFSAREINAVNELIERKIREPATFGNATVDVLQGPLIGRRMRAKDAPPEAFTGPIKINDLFLDEPVVRDLALSRRLSEILAQLLGGAPMVCNSLNFLWGSQQPDHFDSWYMPPPVANKMVVSSICLEDVRPQAGPLAYYPGSHRIEPYRFSHGGIHAIEEEMAACRAYIESRIDAAGCRREIFLGKAGDVFLWHGQLLHGGSPIENTTLTRKTLVTHYWRACDVSPELASKVHDNAYHLIREHQAVV